MSSYIQRPLALIGAYVAASSTSEMTCCINYCRARYQATKKGYILTKSFVDTGCGTMTLLSSCLATNLATALQPCAQTFAMTGGRIVACQGEATVKLKVQGNTFNVRYAVLPMHDTFDLVLRQQFMKEHRTIKDYNSQRITLQNGQSTCTLTAPRETTSYTPDAQHAAQPMSTAAVRRHLIKLGQVYEFRIYESMTDLNHRP
jgi:hypothetical protein